jgi:hypothetical protein
MTQPPDDVAAGDVEVLFLAGKGRSGGTLQTDIGTGYVVLAHRSP